MKKNKPDTQSLVNNILVAAVAALAIYSAALTYVVLVNQKANQGVSDSLAEQLFKLQLKVDNN
jgi:hypothetical protein